jgi:hypothetical protein
MTRRRREQIGLGADAMALLSIARGVEQNREQSCGRRVADWFREEL